MSNNGRQQVTWNGSQWIGPDGKVIDPGVAQLAINFPNGFHAPDARRAMEDEILAKANGFAPKDPIYALGHPVNEVGHENFRVKRAEHQALPFVDEGCDQFESAISAQHRSDLTVPVAGLYLHNNGRLDGLFDFYKAGAPGPIALTERGFLGLASRVCPSGGHYLKGCPPDLRATNVNHWTNAIGMKEAKARKAAYAGEGELGLDGSAVPASKKLVVRTRKNEKTGGREAWAVVTPDYKIFDADRVASAIKTCQTNGSIPKDARISIRHDGYKTVFDVQFFSNIKPENCVAGEMFQAGFRIICWDDGTGSISGSAYVLRNLCLNLIILHRATQLIFRQAHRGQSIEEKIAKGIANCQKRVDGFARKWSEANVEDVVEKYGVDDVEALMKALVYTRAVWVSGVGRDDMVAKLMGAWSKEPMRTKAGIVNAITRTAHEETWESPWSTDELEQQAGDLLYQQNWVIRTDLDGEEASPS